MNLIAAVWLLTALFPQFSQFGTSAGLPTASVNDALRWMGKGYMMLVLGDILVLGGSIALLFSKSAAP
jgi:hypothetical protein